ncbi:class I SAM-dependent methyltransferase [Cognatishimia sp. SS12]|uniref:class I SAM-dependent methyltransferase n=1 Tax=Cognatishimia sp. SS12 TaxID=2979465 RepID=UPI00232C3B42|nr:class I SAM-dependent methyltransferase [Cognatishimia sp. SS12]MDC0739278.1 class I SAM-dependent methyltransferase [Cognatishimia sp. SS12]
MTQPPKSDPSIRSVTQQNLRAWNEAAPIHARHNLADLIEACRNPGFSCLDRTATEMLHRLEVASKDVAQICCNNGIELVSIKNMGAARGVGFDGAQGFLDQAAQLAQAADQDIEFVCSDIYDIARHYNRAFDLLVITIGVLGWMPDIAGFFDRIAKLLRPGSAIFIYEHHPVLMMLKPDRAGAPVEWELSYFRTAPYVDDSGLDYYGGELYEATPNQSFSHKMSDIIMAGIAAGTEVEHFEELPQHISNAWWNVESADIGLPMSYTLILRKRG